MSRFHKALLVALTLAAAARWLGSTGALMGIGAGFAAAVALGVAIPRLGFFGPFVCRGPSDRRCVALTFDDGPDPRSTPRLLDLLREAGVQAAFFGVGEKVAAHGELAARIIREGHLLENHSYSHSHFTNFFSAARLRRELERTQEAVRMTTGTAPRCFRPPMGLSNPRIFRAAKALDLTVVGWSSRGLDTVLADPERIVRRIVRRLEPGAIVLLHDGNVPGERLIPAVKTLLDRVRELGYEVVRLDRMLK
jgi:peptidoglycan/xylan/chitin deacetylase (PgdA/CDA1 family)